jgi:hypothetical protein
VFESVIWRERETKWGVEIEKEGKGVDKGKERRG